MLDGNWFLEQIGADLDRGRQLRVMAEGVLRPSTTPAAFYEVLGQQEQHHATAQEGRNGEGREGPQEAGQARQAPRSRASDTPAQELRSAELAGKISAYQATDLASALTEYKQLGLRLAPPGAWLNGTIRPVLGHKDSAAIVLVYPFDPIYPIRCWAWWDVGVWVGPRHTNYGDGSVCAFEPADTIGAWRPGDPLLQMLDYIACWIARHIFLKRIGRWPGPQSLHTALERLTDHAHDELCGCGSRELYDACHRPRDLAMSESERRIEFLRFCPHPFRHPPRTQEDCMQLAMQIPVSVGHMRARYELPCMLRTPFSIK
jgi:hypothetical protein